MPEARAVAILLIESTLLSLISQSLSQLYSVLVIIGPSYQTRVRT